jgi:hypothetical protein
MAAPNRHRLLFWEESHPAPVTVIWHNRRSAVKSFLDRRILNHFDLISMGKTEKQFALNPTFRGALVPASLEATPWGPTPHHVQHGLTPALPFVKPLIAHLCEYRPAPDIECRVTAIGDTCSRAGVRPEQRVTFLGYTTLGWVWGWVYWDQLRLLCASPPARGLFQKQSHKENQNGPAGRHPQRRRETVPLR